MVHSSVQLEYQGFVIQVDPWSAISSSNYKTADIILVTDNPGHHLDIKAIRSLSGPTTSVVAPANSAARLLMPLPLDVAKIFSPQSKPRTR